LNDLNCPVYVGMSILDIWKHLIYDSYYNQMNKLLYVYTDYLLLEIQTGTCTRTGTWTRRSIAV